MCGLQIPEPLPFKLRHRTDWDEASAEPAAPPDPRGPNSRDSGTVLAVQASPRGPEWVCAVRHICVLV